METNQTKVTRKYQTTIPRRIRRRLGVKAGEQVEWHVLKEMVVVKASRRIANPTEFLCSQGKEDADAVKLVRQVRDELA